MLKLVSANVGILARRCKGLDWVIPWAVRKQCDGEGAGSIEGTGTKTPGPPVGSVEMLPGRTKRRTQRSRLFLSDEISLWTILTNRASVIEPWVRGNVELAMRGGTTSATCWFLEGFFD